MSRQNKLVALVLAIILLALVGVVYMVNFSTDNSQLEQKQSEARVEEKVSPEQPKVSTNVIQSAQQLTEVLKTHNVQVDTPVPPVDYETQTLLAFIYQSPTPGFRIEVSIDDNAANVIITQPAKGCARTQVITPIVAYAVVPLTKQAPVVSSETKESLAECNF